MYRLSQASGRAVGTVPSVAGLDSAGRGVHVSQLLLPSQRALRGTSQQGWQIPTRVGQSRISGAGNGRFSLTAVPKMTRVVVKPYIPMRNVTSLHDVSANHTITFENEDEIERYISLSFVEGGLSREQVLRELADFVYGFDGYRACLNHSTWSMNHADHLSTSGRLNVEFVDHVLDDGRVALVGRAIDVILPNDELTNNYRDFVIPPFYLEFCEKNGIKDVRTMVMEALGDTEWKRNNWEMLGMVDDQ